MKRIAFLLMVCLVALGSMAQGTGNEARRVLDRCAQTLQRAGAVQAAFNMTQFAGGKEQGRIAGLYYVKGNKFHLSSSQTKVWFDGKTQYTYYASTNEVNVTQPNKAEQQRSNPYTFIYMYKQGYAATLSSETLRGEACHTVHLQATGSQPIKEMYVTISKQSNLPLCVRFRQGSNWARISLSQVKTHQNFKADRFKFPGKEFATAEIVDLR